MSCNRKQSKSKSTLESKYETGLHSLLALDQLKPAFSEESPSFGAAVRWSWGERKAWRPTFLAFRRREAFPKRVTSEKRRQDRMKGKGFRCKEHFSCNKKRSIGLCRQSGREDFQSLTARNWKGKETVPLLAVNAFPFPCLSTFPWQARPTSHLLQTTHIERARSEERGARAKKKRCARRERVNRALYIQHLLNEWRHSYFN